MNPYQQPPVPAPAYHTPQPVYGSMPIRHEVIVTDVKMPFGSMVVFIIKWTLASIPALLILAVLTAIFWGVLAGVLGSMVGFGRFRF